MSNLSAFPYIQERSEATPGLFNLPLSIISANIAALDSGLTSSSPSGNTFSFLTNIETSGGAHFQFLSIGSTPPSYVTTAAVTIEVNSAYSDYMYFVDSSAQKSSYIIGSRAGGLSDGLNIWDASAGTMIASFSKQSIRFFQNVVGPVFDVGGALASTYNAGTFGTGADSKESRIQAAINQASIDGVKRVYVPANMYPYSASSVSFVHTVQMVREGGDWSVFDCQAYGTYGDNSRDDAPAIIGAIAGAEQAGSGVVYLSVGTYQTQSTLTFSKSGVVFQGLLGSFNPDVGPVAGSKILYNGAVGGTVVAFSPSPIGAGNPALKRGIMRDISVRGQQRADIGLLVRSVQGGYFERLYIDSCRSTGLLCSSVTTLGENRDVQHCVFTGLSIRATTSGVTNAVCITCDGDGTVVTNTNQSDFDDISVVHSYGTGIQLNNCDDLRFWGVKVFRTSGTTGLGIDISGGGGVDGLCARSHLFGWLSAGDGGLTARTGSRDNVILSYSQENGEPLPTIQSAATLFYTATGYPSGTGINHWRLGTMSTFSGSATTPSMAFNSERSLGWYSSASSTMALAYGTLSLPAAGSGIIAASVIESTGGKFRAPSGTAAAPVFDFSTEDALGWYRSAASRLALSYGQLDLPDGSAAQPSTAFRSEASLGWYRAGSQFIALSQGTLHVPGHIRGAVVHGFDGSTTEPSIGFLSEASLGFLRSSNSVVRLAYGQLSVDSGSATTPGIGFSDVSLGLYKSGAQTIAQSLGTFDLTAAIASIGTLRIKSGANNSCGTAVLGSNGSVNVANTYVKTGDLIFLTDQTAGGTLGDLELGGIRNSSGFTIQSTSLTDTSTVGWLIIRPG